MNGNDHSTPPDRPQRKGPPPLRQGTGVPPSATHRTIAPWIIVAACVAGAGVVLCCVIVLAVVLVALTPRRETPVQTAQVAPAAPPVASSGRTQSGDPQMRMRAEEEPGDEFEAAAPMDQPPPPPDPPAEKEKPKPPPPPPDPFKDIKQRKNLLQLPPLTVSTGTGTFVRQQPNTDQVELAKLDVKSSQEVELTLVGSEFEARNLQNNEIQVVDEQGTRRWEVESEVTIPGLGSRETRKVATFALKDGVLRFNWETERPPVRLAFCSLQLTAGGKTEKCRFELAAKTVATAQLNSEPGARIKLIGPEDIILRNEDDLVLELHFSGIEGVVFAGKRSRCTLKEPKATVAVPVPKYHPNASDTKVSVELNLILESQSESLYLESNPLGNFSELQLQKVQTIDAGESRLDWRRVQDGKELTDNNIEDHRKKTEEHLREFDLTSRRKGFPIEHWREATAERRRRAVGEYEKLHAQIRALHAKRRLDEGERSRLNSLTAQADAIVKKDAEVPGLHQRCNLANPGNLAYAIAYNFFSDFVEEMNAWCDAMKQFKMDLHNKARLDYRLYIKIDGREIDLVVTEGFR